MLVYKKITNRNVIEETGLKEASHYYALTDAIDLSATELTKGLSHIIEQVPEGSDPKTEPALFNVYKIISSTGYATGDLVFLKKVGYSNGTKVVAYKDGWSEKDAQQISVTTSKTIAITKL